MPIGKDKKIIQVIVHKNVKTFIDKYSNIFHQSASEFCNTAISEKIVKLMQMELDIENKKSDTIN